MQMVNALIKDFEKLNLENFRILIRSNTIENFPLIDTELKVEHIKNKLIKGFARNHNTNYKLYQCDYFAVINRDLRISDSEIFKTFINYACQTINIFYVRQSKRQMGILKIPFAIFQQ